MSGRVEAARHAAGMSRGQQVAAVLTAVIAAAAETPEETE